MRQGRKTRARATDNGCARTYDVLRFFGVFETKESWKALLATRREGPLLERYERAQANYRERLRECHPDALGGCEEKAKRVIAEWKRLRRTLTRVMAKAERW